MRAKLISGKNCNCNARPLDEFFARDVNYQGLIHSRTSFPGPRSIRRRQSRELFVSRFRYYYVLRLLAVHRFPFRFRL